MAMSIIFLVPWALTFPTVEGGAPSSREWLIQDNLNFIMYSTLGGLAMVRYVNLNSRGTTRTNQA